MAGESTITINVRARDQASPALRQVNQSLRGLEAGSRGGVGLASALTGIGGAAMLAAAGVAALVAGTVASIKAASSLNEALNKTDVVFGESSARVKAFAHDAAMSFGLSSSEALKAASGFGAMLTTLGMTKSAAADMSMELVGVAADMTSMFDVVGGTDEMLGKLMSGLAGEAKPLREFGIDLSEAAVSAEAFRMTHKNVASQLTQSEKVQARYNLILKQASIAHGDFVNTSKEFANSQRIISALITSISETFGTAFLPALKPLMQSLKDLFQGLNNGLKSALADPAVMESINALVDVVGASVDVFGALLPLLGNIARTIMDFLAPVMRIVAMIFRGFASVLTAVNRELKPLWDFLRAVAQQIKSILGYLFPLVAAFFRLSKGGEDAGGAMSRFLSSINPFGPNLDLATRAVIALADAIAVFVLYKAITITVSVVSAAAALALTALTTLLTLINAGATALVTAVTTVANVAIAITHAALRAIERTYFAVISVSVVLGAGLALAGIGIGLAGLKEAYDVLVSASADTKAADDSMDALKERLTSLREPATPWTFTITGITRDALSVLETLRLSILEIVSPNAPWQFEVFGIVAGALAELGKLMEALRFVPEAVTIGFGLDFGGIEAGIKSVVDALASIPRMITTVVRTVSGDNAIADSTGPNSSGLSVPPAAAGAGGVTMNAVLGAAAVTAGAIAATIVQAVAGGRRGFACFTADTRVWTSHGLARIADIVPGDIVEVYDPKTGTVVMSAVADTLVHPDHPVWHLRINGDAISTTAEHPFLTPDGWRRADELRAGSHVVTATGHEVVEESHDAGRIATVYNIHVDHPAHTYLVGTARWVVHNFKTVGAEGAIVNRATMALIGEAGPEALIPLSRTAGNGPLSGLGGVTINGLTINVSGFADPNAAGASAADAFRRQLGLQRRLPFGTS